MPRSGLVSKAIRNPIANKTQWSFTYPDNHLMMSDSHYIHGYSRQVGVVSDHKVAVAVSVSNQAPDAE